MPFEILGQMLLMDSASIIIQFLLRIKRDLLEIGLPMCGSTGLLGEPHVLQKSLLYGVGPSMPKTAGIFLSGMLGKQRTLSL